MMYLIFPIEHAAINRSEQIAIANGCTGDITKYWFGWIISYTNPIEAALMVPEDDTDKLTPAEVAELKNQTYMETNGWFPPTSELL